MQKKILTGKLAKKICNQILKSAKDDGNSVTYPKHENACGYFGEKDGNGKRVITAFVNTNCNMWMENFTTAKQAMAYCCQ